MADTTPVPVDAAATYGTDDRSGSSDKVTVVSDSTSEGHAGDSRDLETGSVVKDEGDDTTLVTARDSKLKSAGQLAVALLVGVIFGICIHKSSVYQATVLRNQFNFENYVMLQVFLTATATSIVVLSVAHSLETWREGADHTQQWFTRKPFGVPAVALGAFLLGAGMSTAGACPGTIWVQIGSGSIRSIVTLLGGATASLAFGIGYDYGIDRFVAWKPLPKKMMAIHEFLGQHRLVVGGAFAVAMAVFLLCLQLFVEGSTFFPSNPVTSAVWNPIFAGIFIGLLQLPLLRILKANLGSSLSVLTLVAAVVRTDKFFVFRVTRSGVKNWWQVVYMLGATLGGTLASLATDEGWYNATEVSYPQAFIGGFLAFIGARMAGGCTSGHGISGAGHLSATSFIAIAAMFAGAIAVRVLFI